MFGYYVDGGRVHLVVSDLTVPTTCYVLRLSGPEGEFTVPLVPSSEQAEPIPPPSYTQMIAPEPPEGEPLADRLLVGPLPEVAISGQYVMTLIDRCCGCETPLGAVTLEAPPMILTPAQADIGAAPRSWLTGSRISLDSSQPAGVGRPSIPFDYCEGVVEYDARFNTMPSAQGWAHAGTGSVANWSLVPGGALRVGTTSPTTSYWEKTVALTTAIDRIYVYGSVLGKDIAAGAIGSGLDIQGMFRDGTNPYVGARAAQRQNRVFFTRLNTAAETAGDTAPATKWVMMGGAARLAGEEAIYEVGAKGENVAYGAAGIFGTVGAAGSVQMLARFGNTVGAPTLAGYYRSVVASGPGRFIRAGFTAFAQTTSPRLRFYFVADANLSTLKTARFLIRYGTGTQDPDLLPSLTTTATINFVDDSVQEVPVSLADLPANAPFWFTVERDWTAAEDALEATVHLLQVSVRIQ